MKKMITLMFVLSVSIFLSLAVDAQNHFGKNKDLIGGPYYERIVKHLAPGDLLAAGLPQKMHGYNWEDDWILQSYMETSYYPNGNVHVETDFDINTGEPTERFTYTYDGTGRIIGMFGETNETGTWENAMNYTIAYDSHGNLSEMIINVWTGEAWMMMFGSQMAYTYTNEGWVSSLTSKNYDFMNGWQWDEKDIFTLDGNGYPTQILFQNYQGAWADSSRYIEIDWHQYIPEVGYGEFEYFVEELWNGSAWITNIRESTVYDGTGGYVMTRQEYQDGWVNLFRETLTVQNDRPTLYKYEDWIDGAWLQSDGEKYLYTFSGDNLTEEIIQTWDSGILNYVNWSKYVYSDFFYTTGQEELFNELTFLAYPNPVTSEITIQLKGDASADSQVEIMNLTGQVVFSGQMDLRSSKPVSIGVGALPDGLYIIQVSSDSELFTKKFLKE
ncbi:MAG: T9SS type A sorting domain-containing protein [Bacteroidales bacterium]|nr:T9SS type A sorting domain-containing protein [Lentimicrobiaceae bacterium]MDD5695678.1 T9SS type A sorting domain-containing protein [Bacteroidales bacterium]